MRAHNLRRTCQNSHTNFILPLPARPGGRQRRKGKRNKDQRVRDGTYNVFRLSGGNFGRNVLPIAQRELPESVGGGCPRNRCRSDEVTKLRLLGARFLGDCKDCHTPRLLGTCILDSLDGARRCSRFVGTSALHVARLTASEAKSVRRISPGLPAFKCRMPHCVCS